MQGTFWLDEKFEQQKREQNKKVYKFEKKVYDCQVSASDVAKRCKGVATYVCDEGPSPRLK